MSKVIILPDTTKNPITKIGQMAGVCWGADISDQKKNYKRGMDCIESGHGRTLEFVNVEMLLDGQSAKFMREWYTHIGCLPTRLQASTRYIEYGDFGYVTPHTIERMEEAKDLFDGCMGYIRNTYSMLRKLGIPQEDASYLLPLGMESKMVDRRNLRNLIDMSRNRMCIRALWEYREGFDDISNGLSNYSDEWATIVKSQFYPKCVGLGYCPERHGCGRYPGKAN